MTSVDSLEATRQVRNYYDKSHKWYKAFYIEKESLAMHYGLWSNNTNQESEALTNTYREVAKLLKPVAKDLVLDCGCGVGGASLWLAQNTLAKYIGVSISENQVKDSSMHAETRNLKGRVDFCEMDYFRTGFKQESFDKVFGIESFCHSYPNPEILFKELYRLLKLSGRLVMVDGILLRSPANEYEQKLADNFCHGFGMSGWCTRDDVLLSLTEAGFRNIKFMDKTKEIKNTVEKLHRLGILTLPIHLLRLFGIISKSESANTMAVFAQKKMYDLGLFGYGIFYAEKS